MNPDDEVVGFALENGYPVLGLYGSYDEEGVTAIGVLIVDLACTGETVEAREEVIIRPSGSDGSGTTNSITKSISDLKSVTEV